MTVIDTRMKSYSGIGRYVRELLANGLEVGSFASDIRPYSLREQTKLTAEIDTIHADLIHFPHINQPLASMSTPRITTIHDLTMLDFPLSHRNTPKKRAKKAVLQLGFKRLLRLNERLIVSSEYVKNELVRRFSIPRSKIYVVHLGISKLSDNSSKPLRPLPDDYLLYVGNALPHKNLRLLVQLANKRPDLSIVLAGKDDHEYQTILNDAPHNITHLDSPSDPELVWLYKNAGAFVFPSFSEGFGLPGLEAMQRGCPVIASDASCLKEIYGDAALYFDPSNLSSLVNALDELDTAMTKERLVSAGNNQVKKYSWGKTAKLTQDAYQKTLEELQG